MEAQAILEQCCCGVQHNELGASPRSNNNLFKAPGLPHAKKFGLHKSRTMSAVINLATRRPPNELARALSALEAMRNPGSPIPPNADELAAYVRGQQTADQALRRRLQLAARQIGLPTETLAALLAAADAME
jgi:hypothetical protein